MNRCEIIEIRNSADAVGYLCSRTASTQCSDRGSNLCESHTRKHAASVTAYSVLPACPSIQRSTRKPRAKERLARDGWQPQNPTTVPDRAALLLSCVGAACGSCQGFSRPALSTLCDSCVTQSTNKKTANEYMRPVIEWKNSRHEIGTTTQHA